MEYGLDDKMPVGVHKGIEIEEILQDNPSYMKWAVENEIAVFDEEVLELVGRI